MIPLNLQDLPGATRIVFLREHFHGKLSQRPMA
jgi:hypothetical protein